MSFELNFVASKKVDKFTTDKQYGVLIDAYEECLHDEAALGKVNKSKNPVRALGSLLRSCDIVVGSVKLIDILDAINAGFFAGTVTRMYNAGSIHRWFVENIKGKHIELGEYVRVTKRQLNSLKLACVTVLDDMSKAEAKLPLMAGVDGVTSFDNAWYRGQLLSAIEVIDDIFASVDFKKEMLFYNPS